MRRTIDGGYSLDDVFDMLDKLEQDIVNIKRIKQASGEVTDFDGLSYWKGKADGLRVALSLIRGWHRAEKS